MKVWRAVGGGDFVSRKPEDIEFSDSSAFNHDVLVAGAIFVAPSEIQALCWGLALDKWNVECIEVRYIRNRNSLQITDNFTDTIVHYTVSGIGDRYYELCLQEAVVLPDDIL
jgi:hypothetical protein